jgi:hypothetical protein
MLASSKRLTVNDWMSIDVPCAEDIIRYESERLHPGILCSESLLSLGTGRASLSHSVAWMHQLTFTTLTRSAMPSLSTRFQRLGIIPRYKNSENCNRFLSPFFESFLSRQRTMSTSPDRDYEDYYRYNSGRWLWDEDSQLRERYKRFNVSELKRIAAKSIGAQTCVSISKLAEGGFNKVFRLIMEDGAIVIARIPNPNAGPPFKTTASEVATMDFVCCLFATMMTSAS